MNSQKFAKAIARNSWIHLPCVLSVIGLALLAPMARGDEKVDEDFWSPGRATTTQLPAGMIRLRTGEVVSPARVKNSGIPPVLFSRWDGTMREGGGNTDPPDPHGAAGPSGVLQAVNVAVAYYPRGSSGTLWMSGLASFFPQSCTGGCANYADPKTLFDPSTGRFYVEMIEYSSSQSFINLAVSKTSNPVTSGSSDWYTYRFEITESTGGTNYGADYPCMGFDGSAIYITCNMLSLPFPPLTFRNCQILIFDKSKVLAGISSITRLDAPAYVNEMTLQPATIIGSSNPGDVAYFGEVNYLSNTTSVRIWALSNPLSATPTLSSTLVTVPNHGGAFNPWTEGAPQPSPGTTISTLDGRAQGNAFWYSGALWFCHTAGHSAGRAIVYYYKIGTNGYPSGTPTLAESGAIDGGPGVWNYQPAIGANARGDVCLVFTQSSSTQVPTIMATSRPASADAFPDPITVIVSPNIYDGNRSPTRWGDYASVTADPADSTFMVTHEYARLNPSPDTDRNWYTVWGNVVTPATPSGWVSNGIALRKAPTSASMPVGCSDGGSGAIVAWVDGRLSPNDIYAMRVTASGTYSTGWPYGGLRGSSALDDGGTDTFNPGIVTDGSGGAFISWQATPSGVRIQHVTSSGALSAGWPSKGLAISTAQTAPAMISDGSGGAFIAWPLSGIKLQRVAGNGSLPWGPNAISISTSGGGVVMASDGAGGLIAAWVQSGNVRVQRLNSSGAAQWTSGGISLTTGSSPCIMADGLGGAIIAFQKTGTGQDIYALRITSTGSIASGWPSGGIPVSSAANDQLGARLVSDGVHGAILAWVDYRNDPSNIVGDIFAQRITADGVVAPGWPANGVAVCSAIGDQSQPVLVQDGTGGAVIAWQDGRADGDIYADHVTNEGFLDPTFPLNGAAICTATNDQSSPTIVGNQGGDAIIAWSDGRPYGSGIYAQHLAFDGSSPASVSNLSGITGRYTAAISWTETGDDGNTGSANHFDLRFSTTPITAASFFSAARLVPPQPSGIPGSLACRDTFLNACTNYYFAVKTYDEAQNASPMSNVLSISTKCSGFTDVSCGPGFAAATDAPLTLSLAAPWPNPAVNRCRFEIGIPIATDSEPIELAIFDISGRRVRTIASGLLPARSYVFDWDLRANNGSRVRPGIYAVRLRGGGSAIRRIIVVEK